MVVCQYFLRGTCRFGSRCINEHPSGGMGFGKSNSFGTFSKNQLGSAGSNTFGRWQGSSGSDDNTDKVIQTIKQDINLWEISKMWPFSCFSHQKEAPCLTDLVDYSPEEIRLEAYKGKESGTFNEYCQNVKQLNEKFTRRRAELKSLTAAAWGQEKQKISAQNSSGLFSSQSMAVGKFSGPSSLFSSQPSQSGANNPFAASVSKSSLFGTSAGQSVFGKDASSMSNSLFKSSQPSAMGSGSTSMGSQSSSIFGSGSYSTFGSKQQVSAFSSGQQAPVTVGQQSLFNGAQQSIFGGSQTSAFGRNQQSIFGGAQNSTFGGGQPSAFSTTQQSTLGGGQPSAFGGGQQSAFGGGQQSAFGGGQQSAFGGGQQSAFGGGQQSAFGGGQKFPLSGNQQPVATTGLFSKSGQQASQGLFTQGNLFGNTTQQQTHLLGQSATGLGNTTQNSGLGLSTSQATAATAVPSANAQNPFLQASIQNNRQESAATVPEVPSSLELSERDLEAYKSDRFLLGQVPECPPPIELC